MGMGEFNSDNHYIYHCEQESLRRNRVVFIVNQRVQNALLGFNLRMIPVSLQGKSFNIIVIQVYAPTTNVEDKVEWFYEDLQQDNLAAATKLLQSCSTLCDPIDSSPPGSSVPEILQARTLEWVSISLFNVGMHTKSLQSCLTLCDSMDSSPLGSSVHAIL